jgi:hypothetical protein
MMNFLDTTGDKFLKLTGVDNPPKPTISARWGVGGSYNARYYQCHKEKLKKKRREYYKFNKSSIADKWKIYYCKNREEILIYQRGRYAKKCAPISEEIPPPDNSIVKTGRTGIGGICPLY